MTKFLKTIFACGLLTLSSIASAQLGFTVTRVEVEPGAAGQFETFIRNFKAAAEEANWPSGWTASQVAVGNTNQYVFVSPFQSHSQLATPVTALLTQVHSPDEVVEVVQDLRDSVRTLVTGTYYAREDLSNPPAQAISNPEVIVSIAVDIEPGKNLEFEEWIQRVVGASDVNYWNTFTKGYGEGPNYVFRSPMASWSDLDQAPVSPQQRVMDQYGPLAGSSILARGQGATASATYSLIVDRPELSYSP